MSEKRKRNTWSHLEVTFFLSLIKEKQVLGLMDGKRLRVSEIFKTLVGPMREKGFTREPAQMIIKYKNLKAEYYKCKRHNRISGNSPMLFEYYNEMEDLLGQRPISLSQEAESGFETINDIPVVSENDVNILNYLETNVDIEMYDDAPDVDGAVPGSSTEPGIKRVPQETPKSLPNNQKECVEYEGTPEHQGSRKRIHQRSHKRSEDPYLTVLKNIDSNILKESQENRNLMKDMFLQQQQSLKECTEIFLRGIKNIFEGSRKGHSESDSD